MICISAFIMCTHMVLICVSISSTVTSCLSILCKSIFHKISWNYTQSSLTGYTLRLLRIFYVPDNKVTSLLPLSKGVFLDKRFIQLNMMFHTCQCCLGLWCTINVSPLENVLFATTSGTNNSFADINLEHYQG